MKEFRKSEIIRGILGSRGWRKRGEE